MVTKNENLGSWRRQERAEEEAEEKRAHQFRRLLRLLRQFEDLNILFQFLTPHS